MSVAGALQRRIKARYNGLTRSSEARCPTIEQLVPSISESGKKRRKARKQKGGGDKAVVVQKERMPEKPPLPFSLLSCAMKQRIKAIYEKISRHKTTMEEKVHEYVNCLVNARNELLQRSENVQRSIKIKKAMLSNPRNYRSSYDRLFEQVRRLETERDNLKKDASIYNYLLERLQESAPYKLMLELSAPENEAPEISFEELLAQEKEDTAFWQPNGKLRSISSK
ncbi:uncharacterized protein LOC133915316 [Phragmites australis]|uniref:uncharacterized protein LOC133915316 n=1 Tax=Phragmites australis TaxID=29695 RepID=UPI002D77B620|nr:uncharacterized protein LOC133915316 [Phragmites australis]